MAYSFMIGVIYSIVVSIGFINSPCIVV